jgi:hypothetical protein
MKTLIAATALVLLLCCFSIRCHSVAQPIANIVATTFNLVYNNNSLVITDTTTMNDIYDVLKTDTLQIGGSFVDIQRRLFYVKQNNVLRIIDMSSKPMKEVRSLTLSDNPFEMHFDQKMKKLYALFQDDHITVKEIDLSNGNLTTVYRDPHRSTLVSSGSSFDSKNGIFYIQLLDTETFAYHIISLNVNTKKVNDEVHLPQVLNRVQYDPATDTIYGVYNKTLQAVSPSGHKIVPIVKLPLEHEDILNAVIDPLAGTYMFQSVQQKVLRNIVISFKDKSVIHNQRAYNQFQWMQYLPQQVQSREYFSLFL